MFWGEMKFERRRGNVMQEPRDIFKKVITVLAEAFGVPVEVVALKTVGNAYRHKDQPIVLLVPDWQDIEAKSPEEQQVISAENARRLYDILKWYEWQTRQETGKYIYGRHPWQLPGMPEPERREPERGEVIPL